MMSMQKAHPSYAMTGAMCTAAAAVVPGSIVEQVLKKGADTQYLRIGHAGGTLECGVDYREERGKTLVIEDTLYQLHRAELSVKAGIPTNFSLTQAGNSICNIFR